MMPTYEYECRSCEHRYSFVLSMEDSDELPPCPGCGSDDVRKLISTVAVVRSAGQKEEDRSRALSQADPAKPQEVAKYFRDHGSRFGEDDFRGTKEWHDAVERVANGGPTLDE
jgi:putative FmdB family regulatory protein